MAVDVVLDGEDALESPAVTRYDVVVLDRDLPGIHRDEVCRRIVAGGAGSRVLMLTAASTVAGVLRPARARAFLITVASRDDYPRHLGYLLQGATDEQVVTLAREVLKVRRATEYAPLVITECSAAELPPTVAGLMLDINAYLTAARKLAALAAVMDLDDTRLAILDADGQLLIQGGPGSGKTTIALLKAARTLERLEPRAAGRVPVVLAGRRPADRDRVAQHLPRTVRDRPEIRTFHAFFMNLVRAHGPLLNGVPAVFLPPDAENPRKADHDGAPEQTRRCRAGTPAVLQVRRLRLPRLLASEPDGCLNIRCLLL
jgi:CheY-like chemotaxis protein